MGHIDRRQLLIGGTAGALGIAAAAMVPTTALADDGEGLVGTWDVQITDTSRAMPAVEGATTFAPGGGLVTMDSGNPSTGIGSWSGGDEGGAFKARFMQFAFNPDGSTAGKVIVTIPNGKKAGNTISGNFTYVIFTLKGAVIFPNGAGTFTGTRFTAA
jgi:hypothetical protein